MQIALKLFWRYLRDTAGKNFHKKSKNVKIIKLIQYFLPSEKSKKLRKFWITFFKSGSTTLIIGTKYQKSENFVQLKDGHAYYYKNYLSLQKLSLFWETFASSKNRRVFKFCIDVLTRIPNKKKFCQINSCEYRSFIFRKTLNFIIFIETLAYSMHNFCEWQNLNKLELNSLFCKINFQKLPLNLENSRNFLLQNF